MLLILVTPLPRWIENWLSVWRHNFCSEEGEEDHHCQETISRLRRTRCSNDKSLLAALSSDLECKNNSATGNGAALLLTVVLAFVAASATY